MLNIVESTLLALASFKQVLQKASQFQSAVQSFSKFQNNQATSGWALYYQAFFSVIYGEIVMDKFRL